MTSLLTNKWPQLLRNSSASGYLTPITLDMCFPCKAIIKEDTKELDVYVHSSICWPFNSVIMGIYVHFIESCGILKHLLLTTVTS